VTTARLEGLRLPVQLSAVLFVLQVEYTIQVNNRYVFTNLTLDLSQALFKLLALSVQLDSGPKVGVFKVFT
jgi:hypothetical protein